ncbi:MAG: hypothetical protein RR035_02230 [Oscillibacter sp.]
MSKKQLDETKQAVGAMAEMAILFFRAVLGTGATMEETMKLTQAYLAALMFGQRSQQQPEDE